MLNKTHKKHFVDEGWTPEEIDIAVKQYDVRSVSQHEAIALLGYYRNVTSGIWFPFGGDFGQLRLDAPGRGVPKYLSPCKGKATPRAWVPTGCTVHTVGVFTEGWKDAFLATVRGGKPVGAVAGVSHVPSVLPQGLGASVVFDSDGSQNANVAQALVKAGLHLKGKIALIPKDAGDKAGFTEFFKAGYGQAGFDKLLASAQDPHQFFLDWLNYLEPSPLPKHCDTLSQLYKKLWRLTWYLDRHCPELRSRVEAFCLKHSRANGAMLSKPEVRSQRGMALRPYFEAETQRQLAERKAAAPQVTGSWSVKNCFDAAVNLTRKGKVELPPAGKLAALMESAWGETLCYRLDFSSFYICGRMAPGLWERVSDREVKELVQRELDAGGAAGEYGQTAVDSTVALLNQRVGVRSWPKAYGLLPFRNGVLRLSDSHLLAHSPAYGFTWQLPYDYLLGATCGPVIDWLKWAVDGEDSVVQLIRACLKAMVLGRTDFQRFLEIIGPGGTGKGTLIRLIQALLGRSNTVSTSLSRIANSRFETSRFMGKRLIFIPDADYNPTAVDVLKQLTGEDYIPWERKGENADYTDGFTLDGWVMVATNKEVVASDHTNALFRRRIPIYFTRVVPEGDRRPMLDFAHDGTLSGDLAPYLPGVFNWVLAMPDELMEAYIKTPRQYVGAMGKFQAESLLQTSSLAGWVNENVVSEPSAWTKVGDKSNPRADCLYPNYLAYCEAGNVKPLSLSKFSEALENLLQKQLGLEAGKRRDRIKGQGFYGIRLVKTETAPATGDVYGPTIHTPIEDAPLTVERALGGLLGQTNQPLSDNELNRLLNLFYDDPNTYQAELRRLTPAQSDYLYRQVPELRSGEVAHA